MKKAEIKMQKNLSEENSTAALENLLFIYGEPLAVKKIAELLETKEEELEKIISEYENQLKNDARRGLSISRLDGRIQLVSKPEFQELLKKIVKQEIKEELTPAALETLSIISYSGPLSRSMIDYLRGVNSSYVLRHLLVRGLIERYPAPQKSYLYNISFKFLKHLGLTKQEDLPDYQKYKDLLEKFEPQT